MKKIRTETWVLFAAILLFVVGAIVVGFAGGSSFSLSDCCSILP